MIDTIIYLFGGAVICAILAGVFILINNKLKKELNTELEKISKESLEKLLKTGFQDSPSNDKFLVGTSIVSNIEKNAEKINVTVVFYNSIWKQYNIGKVSMDLNTFNQKSIQQGSFVKTLHARDNDGVLKVKEIL